MNRPPNESAAMAVRPATPADVPQILAFIRELGEYERLSHEVVATEELIHDALFGPRPVAEALIGELGGEPAGFALYFHNFSTFVGRAGIYLEDLYVRPQFRGRGMGKALLLHLIGLAHERGCGRVEWAVLDWNEPAIRFYKSLGAEPMDGWTIYRVADDAFERLAKSRAPR